MFRVLTVIALPTAVLIAAIVPVDGVSPSRTPTLTSPAPTVAPTPTQEENKEAVRKVLKAQQIAWNHGDIQTFMDGYWRSRDTVFVSGDTVTRGWQTVHDRYRSKYPNREKMGELTFSEVEVHMFGYDGALAFGRWRLDRGADNPHGHFTLIFRNMAEGWKIVHDHTSEASEG